MNSRTFTNDSETPFRCKDAKRDLILLRKISKKNTHAFSEFYDIHSRYLYTIIYFILHDETEAEDLLQEVFLKIWEKVDSYDEGLGNPLSWVSCITRNKSIDRLRSRSYRQKMSENNIEKCFNLSETGAASNPEKTASLNQEHDEIINALQTLNKNQSDLIKLAYYGGYTQAELAEHFNIPLGTIKTRMRKAMILLRAKLKNLEFEMSYS